MNQTGLSGVSSLTEHLKTFVRAIPDVIAGIPRYIDTYVIRRKTGGFKIGSPVNFPVGTVKRFDNKGLFVLSDDQGIYAISAVCTHLGCLVSATGTGFQCPCHGASFDATGKVTGGPARRALPWFKLTQDAGGSIVVDTSREVSPGTKTILS
ncbi:MAG: Rieske (2Fe-2S) protein [Nitrospirae bacterium]|uniref:QcrA and Rieske domain-containing protein n=1 Tax=Candidatus Magnetobacterium casense TaxID=1455061 RepID=UPI0006968539|nr:Rieske (2Fe-2S) protein [Candidatus Magnetobacterium casensis]MBF0339099.1 Rieske (2Fe-2S) protein [Nitrospirota bacterium]